jgi:hypothetical protein
VVLAARILGLQALKQTAPRADVLSMKSKYARGRGYSHPLCLLAPLCLVLGLALILSGCNPGSFDFSKVQYMVEINPISLDGEQVMLTESHIQCGVQSELWDVTQLGPNRAVARLNQAARDLHFGDDVIIGEPGTHTPYVQIRGTFQLRVLDLGSVREEGEKVKLADVKIGVEIPHPCFRDQLPQLMAVRRGRFTQDALPTFRFRNDNDWAYDRVQH